MGGGSGFWGLGFRGQALGCIGFRDLGVRV